MEQKHLTYHQQEIMENTLKLREILSTLPIFVRDYFKGIEPTTSTKTRISYAYDIKIFFRFLKETNPMFQNIELTDFKLSILEQLTASDIEEYLEYIKVYKNESGKIQMNDERARHRKMSTLRSFFNYFNKRQFIENNPVLLVDMPKIHEKEIIRLDYDEVAALLDLVEHGSANLTGMKKVYYEKNKIRNLAIFTLLLGTGIRVSECVGLNIEDVDFSNCRIKIIRKGGKEDFVYFGDEVEQALSNYIETTRCQINAIEGHEHALFLSIQKRRMTVRAIEQLVSEHAKQITTIKHITPHKLRSTYGTTLYRETDDIYLVAEVLGHNDVNTTKKHYAALDEDRKRRASKVVKLREP